MEILQSTFKIIIQINSLKAMPEVEEELIEEKELIHAKNVIIQQQ